MNLLSQDIHDNAILSQRHVFNGMGHTGDNVSPQLKWDDVPPETKSFVVTCYDPDAPTGSGWWHWVMINIPSDIRELQQGAGSGLVTLPQGCLQTRTDFGNAVYGGAAPPDDSKFHHYIFTVHALDIDHLDLDKDASAAMVGFYVHYHSIDSASITALYR